MNRLTSAGIALCIICCVKVAPMAAAQEAVPSASVDVDLRDAPRKLFHSHMSLQVAPGPLTLLYPKYIPGEHGPTGPIVDVAGLHFRAHGEDLPWHRDLVDMFTFHLQMPEGATELTIDLDFLSPTGGRFTSGASATPNLAALNWNQVLFYPAGVKAAQWKVTPSMRIPQGWSFATALRERSREGDRVLFAPVSLETLVDAPVIAGRYFKEINISPPGGPPHFLDMVGDRPKALVLSAADIAHHKNLVIEAGALFGARHYRAYHFLLTLSDQTAHFGLEHHESSDDRTGERLFLDPAQKLVGSGLLPHEFVHSWNGKYRRPADLATPDFQQPMRTDLLWVYEGLTTYLGEVLSARCGLRTPAQFRELLALTSATMDHHTGRTWRPLGDTTAAAQTLYEAPRTWTSWRRGTDFYPEGLLIWLEVDTTLRRLSHDQKSLDDFTHLFHGGQPGFVGVKTYTLDDIAADLGRIVPHDWAGFLRERLERREKGAPLDGVIASGWRLVYTTERSSFMKATEKTRHQVNELFSIGLMAGSKGGITDVLWQGPAFQAGLGAGMTIVAVNGREFSPEILRDAVGWSATNSAPLKLLVKNQGFYTTHAIDNNGGERCPHLARIEGVPDYLSEIIAPHRTAAR